MAVPVRRRDGGQAQAPARWEPLRELEELTDQMGQLMGGVLPASLADVNAFRPPVDIEETEDAWIVEAEVPGAAREDVDVETREGEIHISGEIKERERTGILRRRTRRVGRFELRVVLPGQIDAENVDAKLDDGILRVRIPKSERSRPRRVQVGSSSGSESAPGSGSQATADAESAST
jgi:HSP20 family protein